jgi:hypoxanthine phosphoribosyltransferase
MQSDPDLETAPPRANAVALLVESHAWRYAVGARPYAVGTPEQERIAGHIFREVMSGYQQILASFSTTAPLSRQITDEMRSMRSRNLDERREIYISRRIEPLQAQSSRECARLGGRWRIVTALVLCVELAGIPGGVLKAIELSQVDLLAITAAAAASFALWVDLLNYPQRTLTAAGVGRNLVSAHDWLEEVMTEDEWAAAVARVEGQLSLESDALLASDASAALRQDAQADDVHSMSTDEYFAAAANLKQQIWEGSANSPKLEPDVIVAVNPGGAILGGILYFMTRGSDFLPLSLRAGLKDDDLAVMLQAVPWLPRKPYLSILLVDASVKSGDSLTKAIELVRSAVEAKGYVSMATPGAVPANSPPRYVLRTAVIAKKPDLAQRHPVQVDYYVNESTERFPYGTI